MFLAAPKMVSFLQLAPEKKTQIYMQLENFWPFLFCDAFSDRKILEGKGR